MYREKEIKKIILLIMFLVVAVGLIVMFTNYNNSKSMKKEHFSDNEIVISSTKSTTNENEVLITVEVPGMDNYEYSFDGGETWQSANILLLSENKEISIKIKGSNGNIVGEKTYKVEVADLTGPIINISLPSEIIKGTNIVIEDYIEVLDISGVAEVNIKKDNFDTNIVGNHEINIIAKDNLGNVTDVSFTTKVVEEETPIEQNNNQSNNNSNGNATNNAPAKKIVYYRYRVKNTSTYECNYYDCSYYDENQTVDATITFDSDSHCCNTGDCKKANPLINNPCPIHAGGCIAVMIPKYTSKGNICYDRSYITVSTEVPDDCKCEDGKKNCIKVNCIAPSTEKTECDDGEANIDGYCHKVDSYGKYSCPEGYNMNNDKCLKKVSKTCSKTCTDSYWGPWSDWTTVYIGESDTIQVETKIA